MEDNLTVSSSVLDLNLLLHQHVNSECLVPVNLYGSLDIIKDFIGSLKSLLYFLEIKLLSLESHKLYLALYG